MLIMVLKYLFIAVSVVLTLMMVYGKMFVFKKKHPAFVSDYCATLAAFLGTYELSGIILAFVLAGIYTKIMVLFFALSPFLIGVLVNFHTEKYWTVAQIMLFIFSAVYAIGI